MHPNVFSRIIKNNNFTYCLKNNFLKKLDKNKLFSGVILDYLNNYYFLKRYATYFGTNQASSV